MRYDGERKRGRAVIWLLVGFLAISPWTSNALTNGLAMTPPMGWSSWNCFAWDINEDIVRQIADAMATNGMRAAGYQYVNVDDTWQGDRDTNGVLTASPYTFPSGIVSLANYVHQRGLKFGLYTARGTNSCCLRPGSYGYEALDGQTFANWGVDYLKDDTCLCPPDDDYYVDYTRMSAALVNSGRPIVFNINAGFYQPWMNDFGNVIRNTTDITTNFARVVALLDSVDALADSAGPGHWNDIDMLEVGNGMTFTEDQAHFSMWCIASAPLIAGNDIRTMSAATKSVLTNTEAIAVDQDISGVQGKRVASCWTASGNLEVWCKPLGTNGMTKAVALFNRSSTSATITAHWREILVQPGPATVRDLWSHKDLGTFFNSFTATVPSHGVKLLKIVGAALPDPGPIPPGVGTNYLSDLRWTRMTNSWGPAERDLSNGECSSGDGQTLTMHGVTYNKGLGVHAYSKLDYYLGGAAMRFQTTVGVDDEACDIASVFVQVLADGVVLYEGAMNRSTTPVKLDLDVTDRQQLSLVVSDTKYYINCDHVDWADAKVIVTAASSRPRIDLAQLSSHELYLSGHSGEPNALFYVLSATNAALPSANWTRVATNRFDDGGYFYFTNTVASSGGQAFFRIWAP